MPSPTIVTPERQDILEEDIVNKSSVSEALLRKFAASMNTLNLYALMPLGTVLENFIPPTNFFDMASNAWVELNGQEYTNTDYGQWEIAQGLKSGTLYLPDGRGMEFVQVNSGRNDGNQNFSNIAAGQFQGNGNKSHGHSILYNWDSSGSFDSSPPEPLEVYVRGDFTENSSKSPEYVSNSGAYGKDLIVKSGQPQATSNRIGVYRYIKVWNVAPDL